MPPALFVQVVSPPKPQGSTQGGRFSDESFRRCDVQFNLPRIRVEPCLLFEELTQIGGTKRSFRAHTAPYVRISSEIKGSLEARPMFAAAADDQQQTSPVRVAPLENRREVPVAGRSPDQRRSFEGRGKPLVVHERGLGLDVFALIRPDQHCGECVAASRAPKLVEDMVVPRHSADRR